MHWIAYALRRCSCVGFFFSSSCEERLSCQDSDWSDAVEHPSYVRIHSSRFSTSGLPLLSLLNWIGLRDLGRLDRAQWSGPLVSQYNQSQCVFFHYSGPLPAPRFHRNLQPPVFNLYNILYVNMRDRAMVSPLFFSNVNFRLQATVPSAAYVMFSWPTYDSWPSSKTCSTVYSGNATTLTLCLMDRESETPNGERCHRSNPIQLFLTLSNNFMN